MFREHTLSYLRVIHRAYLLFNLAPQLSYTSKSETMIGMVESLDMDCKLVKSCGAMEVLVMKSAIAHDRAAMRGFTKVQFGKSSLFGKIVKYSCTPIREMVII